MDYIEEDSMCFWHLSLSFEFSDTKDISVHSAITPFRGGREPMVGTCTYFVYFVCNVKQ